MTDSCGFQAVLDGVPLTGCVIARSLFWANQLGVSLWKNFGSAMWNLRCWCVEEIVWNLLRPISLEIEGRNSTKKFTKLSPHFSSVSLKFTTKNHPNFALGNYGHNLLTVSASAKAVMGSQRVQQRCASKGWRRPSLGNIPVTPTTSIFPIRTVDWEKITVFSSPLRVFWGYFFAKRILFGFVKVLQK